MKLGDITSEDRWPDVGWHECVCVGVEKVVPDSYTPYVSVCWAAAKVRFHDRLYMTTAAAPRMVILLTRVCGYDAEIDVPQEPDAMLSFLSDSLCGDLPDRRALVHVIDRPNKAGEMKRQVAFDGYGRPPDTKKIAQPPDADEPEPTRGEDDAEPTHAEDLPF